MCVGYLLGECVEFHPGENLLTNRKSKQQRAVLSPTTTRCLLLLIKNRELVTQSELFEFVWEENAISATPNNLYQNISLLRRALKSVSDRSNSWVVTVPRRGFRLDRDLDIAPLDLTAAAEPTDIAQKMTATTKAVGEKSRYWKLKLENRRSLLLYSTLFIIFAITLFILDNTIFPGASLAQNFIFHQEQNGCRIYINKDAQESKTHMNVFAAIRTDCQHNPYTYITAYPILHSASVLSCTASISSKDPFCISHVIRGFKSS
ncbi:hypothetical protein FEM41_16350 [Jejubacter calystegiae]|uniref:OmpR/PhoB-type domain-containing protein n=1 Tax=Jejubacter calystegiae TaxID=2579935 RepID=A0A4P8YN14_9ENTR|nr:hypothetical protein FEM41_16350 [Jejubacter calystegiae]